MGEKQFLKRRKNDFGSSVCQFVVFPFKKRQVDFAMSSYNSYSLFKIVLKYIAFEIIL